MLALGVELRFHGRAFFPHAFALERELGEIFQLLITGDVEELLAALRVHREPVPAALKLAAERADEFPLRIEDEDRRVILELLAALVDDVEEALAVHGDVVRGLPGVWRRQLGPVVQHLVAVSAGADKE